MEIIFSLGETIAKTCNMFLPYGYFNLALHVNIRIDLLYLVNHHDNFLLANKLFCNGYKDSYCEILNFLFISWGHCWTILWNIHNTLIDKWGCNKKDKINKRVFHDVSYFMIFACILGLLGLFYKFIHITFIFLNSLITLLLFFIILCR